MTLDLAKKLPFKRRKERTDEGATEGSTMKPMCVEDGDQRILNGQKGSKNGSRRNKRRGIIGFVSNKENLLVTMTVLSVVLSMTIGLAVKMNTGKVSYRTIQLISYPGELLMNMLKMLIIPLIISSLVSGLVGLDPRSSGKMGSYAVLYYISTTLMAVILGIILVIIIHPGRADIKEQLGSGTTSNKMPSTLDAFLDLFRNLFPPNLIQATLEQSRSEYRNVTLKRNFITIRNDTNDTLFSANISDSSYKPLMEEQIITTFVTSTNVLGLVSFSIAFGLIMGQMGEKALIMIQFFNILNEVIMRMVQIIMWYSPFGIFFLIMGKILEIDDLAKTAASLGLYMLTVVLGLIIHACGTLSIMFYVITKKSPLKFFKGVFQAWITALGTASSAATLPITFRCLEENIGIDKRVTRFVLPIGATINMDGTALYEAVASIFIAQINDISLNFGQIITVSFTATLAAIGAASVPSAGLVTMVLVLSAVGLPINDISLILAVDWLLDRLRTSVNVLGDAFGAGIVAHLSRAELEAMDAAEASREEPVLNETEKRRNSKKNEWCATAYPPEELEDVTTTH